MTELKLSPAKDPAKLVHLETDYCLATWKQVFILIWRVNTTLAGVQKLRARVSNFGMTSSGGIALLTIVEEDASVPPAEAREALARFLHDAGWCIKCSAVAYEGTALRAAFVRSIVTGLSLLARQPYPHKVFPSVAQAAGWLVPEMINTRVTANLTAGELREAVAGLRSSFALKADR